jgi:hypothetical protein
MKLRKQKSADVIKSVSDDTGNLLVCKNNGTRIILSLKLIEEKRYRKLGVINIKQRTITVKRDRDRHLFRKFQAYGMNHKLLSETKLFDKVRLSDQHCEWLVPKEYILNNGEFLHFKKTGFELQIFITIHKIEEFKRQPKY